MGLLVDELERRLGPEIDLTKPHERAQRFPSA